MPPVVTVRGPELGHGAVEEPAAGEKPALEEQRGRVDEPWALTPVKELTEGAADSEPARADEREERLGRNVGGGPAGPPGRLTPRERG